MIRPIWFVLKTGNIWRQTSLQNLFKSTLGEKLTMYIPWICLSGQTNMCAADKLEPDACAALKNENSSLAVAHHGKKKNPDETQLTPIIHRESNWCINYGDLWRRWSESNRGSFAQLFTCVSCCCINKWINRHGDFRVSLSYNANLTVLPPQHDFVHFWGPVRDSTLASSRKSGIYYVQSMVASSGYHSRVTPPWLITLDETRDHLMIHVLCL